MSKIQFEIIGDYVVKNTPILSTSDIYISTRYCDG